MYFGVQISKIAPSCRRIVLTSGGCNKAGVEEDFFWPVW